MVDGSQSPLFGPREDPDATHEDCNVCGVRTPIATHDVCGGCGGRVTTSPGVRGFGYRHYHKIASRNGYCKTCGNITWMVRTQEWLKASTPVESECVACGGVVLTSVSKNRTSDYCQDPDCQQWKYRIGKACKVEFAVCAADDCTELFARRPQQPGHVKKYCSDGCARHAGRKRRRERIKARKRKRVGRRRKWEMPRVAREALRQGYRCWHCRKVMRVAGDPLHPLYWTEEHVVPISQGGSDEDDNVVAACRRCNQSRGSNGSIQLGIDRDGGTAA